MNVNVEDDQHPYHLFKLFITDDLVEMIVIETNKYTDQSLAYSDLGFRGKPSQEEEEDPLRLEERRFPK